jgi:hypothetical protein
MVFSLISENKQFNSSRTDGDFRHEWGDTEIAKNI